MTLDLIVLSDRDVLVVMFGTQITGDSRKAKKLEEVSLSRVAETTFRFKSAAAEVETLKVKYGFKDIV